MKKYASILDVSMMKMGNASDSPLLVPVTVFYLGREGRSSDPSDSLLGLRGLHLILLHLGMRLCQLLHQPLHTRINLLGNSSTTKQPRPITVQQIREFLEFGFPFSNLD